MSNRERIREIEINIGERETGARNKITDVVNVKVGHSTIINGEGKLIYGKGPVRTGVTAVLPHTGNIYKGSVFSEMKKHKLI